MKTEMFTGERNRNTSHRTGENPDAEQNACGLFFFKKKEKTRSPAKVAKKFGPFLDLCVSSLRRGHANLLCIVPILSDVPEGTTL